VCRYIGGRRRRVAWSFWPETVITLPILLTSWLLGLNAGMQLSLKWSRTIVRELASLHPGSAGDGRALSVLGVAACRRQ